MTVVNPLIPANLFLPSASPGAASVAERQVDLRLEQMVRATVVEGGVDKALLEMNHRHYRAQSDLELLAGQKLTLQVLQTDPRLEFRIVRDPLGGKLNQLLPLLSRPYDWAQLLDRLGQQPQQRGLPQSIAQVYQQLRQLVRPDGQLPVVLEKGLAQLPGQLQQLVLSVAANQLGAESRIPLARSDQPLLYLRAEGPLPLDLPKLLQGLQQQLATARATGTTLSQVWTAETNALLAPLQQGQTLQTLTPPLQNELLGLLTQLQQRPNLPLAVAVGLERLVLQLTLTTGRELSGADSAGQRPVPNQQPVVTTPAPQQLPGVPGRPIPQSLEAQKAAAPQIVPAAAGQRSPSTGVYGPPVAVAPTLPAPAAVPAEVSAEMAQLLAHIQQDQGQGSRLSPELLGRLEGLLDKLQQLPQAAQPGQPLLPNLEQLSGQLLQLVQQGPQRPEGGQLGFLSQLFGFHLEAELLQGKKKEALASLKLALLSLRDELGEEVKEPLRRVELFQLCKARLAEEQVQFLPLPFHELEEGYLLMEQQEADQTEGAAPLQMSMSLRLSALGNMRVDMLYDQQGLHLRLASEDKEKMAYLQEHSTELEDAIEAVPLRGVSFSADAQVPSRELLQRILPEALGMLDTRI